ncbi:MAG: DUF1841 family protein [Acidimicrobiales bacterium]
MNAGERRAWLYPPATGRFRGIDLGLLDPDDEGERRLLVEAEHPELAVALEGGLDEIDGGGGPMSPRLHIAMHELVANQLSQDDPPEMWPTVERLVDAGYDRHEVLHMLGSVAAQELWQVQRSEPFDRERYSAALAALPGSWAEGEGPDGAGDDPPGSAWRLPDGTTLTHRLTEDEAAGGSVAFAPDLEPLTAMFGMDGLLHLATGEVAERGYDDGKEVLTGPDGWLSAGAGDLIGFRVAGDQVEVSPVVDPPVMVGLGGRLRAAFDLLNGGDGLPVTVAELLSETLADTSAAPTTLLPVGELLTSFGFETRGGYAAPEGADWETFGRVQAAALVAMMNGLGPKSAHALVLISELYQAVIAGELRLDEHPDMAKEVAAMLNDPGLGRAFVDLGQGPSGGEHLDAFLASVRRGAARRDRAGVSWAMSLAAAAAGDHHRAEARLGEALEADPDHEEALSEAAWYASDRGDARRATELLGRLGRLGRDDVEGLAAALRPYARPPVALAGRNDPVPAARGASTSGAACPPRVAPLPERTGWIWAKLEWFLEMAGFDDELDGVLDALGGAGYGHELTAASLVLFVDRAVDEFLELRGPLLPDDERSLVEQWVLVEHSVHEVVAVQEGVGLTVRDIRTGDVEDVRERLGSRSLAVGELIFAQVVPDGGGYQLVGGAVRVPLHLRDPLVELLDGGPDAVELAGLLGAASAPPQILNMEGEDITLCTARYTIDDPASLAALDLILDRDDELTWSESVRIDDRPWVRGTVTVEGRELVLSANSDARFGRLRAAVEFALPGLELVAAEAIPAADAAAARGAGAVGPMPQPVPVEAAGAVAAFMREQEDRWMSEPVPALAGLTPREAAADPTRREELEALLNEFDRHQPPPGAFTFDTGRLRTALGLTGN